LACGLLGAVPGGIAFALIASEASLVPARGLSGQGGLVCPSGGLVEMERVRALPAVGGRDRGRLACVDGGLERARVAEIQRARIVAAMLHVLCERGAGQATVAHVVARSGVSRRTFYETFSDCEECFVAAVGEAFTRVCERVLPAYDAEKGWREKIRAGLTVLLRFLDEEPVIGRALVVETLGGPPATLARRGQVVAQLASAIESARDEMKVKIAPPPLTGESLVGGALAVIHARLTEEDHAPLVGLTNALMSTIVLPYMGAAAARRELERPAPSPPPEHSKTTLSDPFKEAGMRLTYRTVRALAAIADHPGASNRLIADTVEIKDQGQISKLLTRLQRAGMIANTGLGPGQGAPNVWNLTQNGHQVVATIKAETAVSSLTD
jgi:AcrR family transcriptional regulator/DNA-binding MarR family transcriptional regulator